MAKVNCNCVSCLGAPWSPVECKAFPENTARNVEMVAETGRNYETTALNMVV